MVAEMRVVLTLYRAWEFPTTATALARLGFQAELHTLREIAHQPAILSPHDVVVVDMRTNPTLGLQTIFAIRRQHGYGPGILALVERQCASTIAAIEAGADSYLSGECCTDILCAAISGLGRLTGKKATCFSHLHAANPKASWPCAV